MDHEVFEPGPGGGFSTVVTGPLGYWEGPGAADYQTGARVPVWSEVWLSGVCRRPRGTELETQIRMVHPHSCSHSEVPPFGFELGQTSQPDFAELFEARSWTVEGPVRPSDTYSRLFLVSPSYSSRFGILK